MVKHLNYKFEIPQQKLQKETVPHSWDELFFWDHLLPKKYIPQAIQFHFYYTFLNLRMAQQAKQAAQKLGGMFPQGSGKGIGGAVGAIAVLGALGYGINASLFNGT